ncbi:MAG: hypothetical protein D9N11_09610 [Ketobacter sp.]|nr:MAG: hypothetical protein D9N11_09610 [Ketobacter sp.]
MISRRSIGVFVLVLTGLFLLSIWSRWLDQHNARNFNFAESAHEWRQPESISALFPNPISPDQWIIQYAPLEQRLFELMGHESANSAAFVINVSALDDLLSLLPGSGLEPISESAGSRLPFLLSKSLPGETGDALADVLPRYARYRHAVAAMVLPKPGEHSTLSAARQRFQKTYELRRQYLGEHWHRHLFAEQEATARQMLDRLQARHDQNRFTRSGAFSVR